MTTGLYVRKPEQRKLGTGFNLVADIPTPVSEPPPRNELERFYRVSREFVQSTPADRTWRNGAA
jgi:hypothetical protein